MVPNVLAENRQGNARIFGATIIHKRRGYKDPATTSRSLFITTKRENDKQHPFISFMDSDRGTFKKLATEITTQPLQRSNRANDLWYPLIEIALAVGDSAWVVWASEQMGKQLAMHSSGGSFDPQKAIILGMLSIAVREDETDRLLFVPGKYELTLIKSFVEKELGTNMSINEIKTTLDLLHFEIRQKRGIFRVNIQGDNLKDICIEHNIEDDAVESII